MPRVQKTSQLEIEHLLWKQGYLNIAGIDEVGRGCLAGPVVVCGVIFDKNHKPINGVYDSKQIRPFEREKLCEAIFQSAKQVEISLVCESMIDEINILEATKVAMMGVIYGFEHLDYILIDGRDLPQTNLHIPSKAIIKGDQLSYSIAAASIVAKVVRDQIMEDLDCLFPNYYWSVNKGYGTKIHRNSILEKGITIHHRKLFVRKILNSQKNLIS